MIRKKAYHSILLLLMSCVALEALAREWYFQPQARVNMEFDTNPQLRSVNIQDAYGIINHLDANYGIRSDRYTIVSTSMLDLYNYWGSSELNLDRQNFYTDLNGNYQLTERSTLGLATVYRKDTSLTSELLNTGLVQNQVPRQSIDVTPTWRYNLSESQMVKSNYSHESVTYDPNNYGLRDYDTDSGSITYLDQWTPKLQYLIALSALHYSSPGIRQLNETTINNYSLNVGFEHRYSETLTFTGSVGARLTETVIKPIAQATSLGWLFAVGMNKQFEVGNISINYNRSVSPTGIGLFLQSDSFDASAEYRFSERFKAVLSSSVIITSSTDSKNKEFDRTYYMIEPKLSWDLTRQATLVGGYRYRWQQYDQSNNALGNEALSNAVYVYINYQWDKFATNSDSYWVKALTTPIARLVLEKPKSANVNFANQDALLTSFFTELKINRLLRYYPPRFRNALYAHYEKFVGKNSESSSNTLL